MTLSIRLAGLARHSLAHLGAVTGQPGHLLLSFATPQGLIARLLPTAAAHTMLLAGQVTGQAITSPDRSGRAGSFLHTMAAGWLPGLVLAVAVWVAASLIVRARARREWRHYVTGARQIRIVPPSRPDPAGAHVLWDKLTVQLALDCWGPLEYQQLHLGWEFSWAGGPGGGLSISVWIPGAVFGGDIERLIEAAWPGARAVSSPATGLLPAAAPVASGTFRPARRAAVPPRADLQPDLLPALGRAAAALGEGERAVVQVLARPAPVTWARWRRRHLRRLHGCQAVEHACRMQAAAVTGQSPDTAPAATWWETQIRYAVTSTAGIPAGRPEAMMRAPGRRTFTKARLRGLARDLDAALNQGPRWWPRRVSARHAPAISTRAFRRGRLLSVPELAALATLPADPTLPGLRPAPVPGNSPGGPQ